MTRYLVRRLIQSVFVLLGVLILVFILARLSGDPAAVYFSPMAPEELRQAFREAHGLDKPIMVQLVRYFVDVAHLDFGESLWMKEPALRIVLRRLPLTLQLAAVTTIASFLVAFVLGTVSALRPLSFIDRALSLISLVGVTTPSFWLALVLILVFAVQLRWLPTSGTGDWRYLVLPGLTLAWGPIGMLAQIVRSSMLEQLSQPYVTSARAKGLHESKVLAKHVGRNALIPTLTVAGSIFVTMANGAVIVETVFGWPGIGKLMMDAIERRDFPLVQSSVFVVAIVVVILNLAIDVGYALVDPRIRYD